MIASSQILLTYREKLLHAWSSFRWTRQLIVRSNPKAAISIGGGTGLAVNIIDVHKAYIGEGRFWHRWIGLSELCIDKVGAFPGAVKTERLCIGSFDDLDLVRATITARLENELIALQQKLASFVLSFEADKATLFDDTRYIQHSRMEAFRIKHETEHTDDLRHQIQTYRSHPAKPTTRNVLKLEARYEAALALLNNAETERKRHNEAYIRREAIRHGLYFKKVEETELSEVSFP